MKISYKEFIELLNNSNVIIKFSIINYAHYNNCQIKAYDEIINGKTNHLIDVCLTNDLSEQICFYQIFKENYKLFRLGRKGSFTLKQIWDRFFIIEIINI